MLVDYRCKKCGETIEDTYRKEEDAPKCPKCGEEMKRVYSAPTLHNMPTRGNT